MARILIVEDNQDLAKVISRRFALAGFEVRSVPDGMLAIREVHQFKPDLILLDLLFPAGGGISVLERLKLSVNTSQIPVMILTGLEDKEYESKARKLGVDAYLKKPYEAEQLIIEAKKLLNIDAA